MGREVFFLSFFSSSFFFFPTYIDAVAGILVEFDAQAGAALGAEKLVLRLGVEAVDCATGLGVTVPVHPCLFGVWQATN